MHFVMDIMYRTLFDSVLLDSFSPQHKTVYVVSDSQLEELKRNQSQAELERIESSRKRLDENYQSRCKILDEREHELKEELKALVP